MSGAIQKSELMSVLGRCRAPLVGIAAFSALVNVLMLTGSLFMLEVYDRVLPSRSVPTLVGLLVIAIVLFAFHATFEIIRGRLLVRIGHYLDRILGPRVFGLSLTLQCRGKPGTDAAQPVRDLDTIRSFWSGAAPVAVFDLPWVPFYLAICFAFHPLIGLTTLAGAAVLVALTVLTEILGRSPLRAAAEHATHRSRLTDGALRNAEVMAAMGMASTLTNRRNAASDAFLAQSQKASDLTGGIGSAGRVLRMLLQSLVLAVGALLVIRQEASAGIIIASSILTGRALAPIDLLLANWKGMVSARLAWTRLDAVLSHLPAQADTLELPRPKSLLAVEGLTIAAPGGQKAIVQDVSFSLRAGSILGVVGASGSGKTSLARALVGAWLPLRGSVKLDNAIIQQWSAERLGQIVGYLPQNAELMAGTIAENIGRFDPTARDDEIVAAAKAANVHDLIVSFPSGYDTQVGDASAALSAGQRQRIALARALFRDPFMVVLDEPNANLDTEGEQALAQALLAIRARGGVAVVVAHRTSVLAAADHVLVLERGAVRSFGPKDEVLGKGRREAPVGLQLKVVPPGAHTP